MNQRKTKKSRSLEVKVLQDCGDDLGGESVDGLVHLKREWIRAAEGGNVEGKRLSRAVKSLVGK